MNAPEQLLIVLSESDSTGNKIISWHKIFPYGVFRHPVYGKLDFRDKFLAEVKSNFDSRVRKIDPFVDFRHENGEAGGWINELELRSGDGLYAKIEWTDIGFDAVQKKHFRYFSPEFGKYEDEVSGQVYTNVLNAVALTNIPFLKTLPDIGIALEEPVNMADLTLLAADCACNPGQECDCADDKQCACNDKSQMAQPAPDDPNASKNKNRPVKPAGAQGAPQPSTPRGAKPHINRGRYPDPTGEQSAMADENKETVSLTETPANVVSLEELRAITAKFEAQIAASETERKALAERVAQAEKVALERDIRDEVRSLSEPRVTVAEDGEENVAVARFGIPAVVAQMYQSFALEHPANREPVLAMLRKLAEVGTVSIEAKGSGNFDPQRDPETPTQKYESGYGADLLTLAEKYAKDHNLDWTKLSDREIAVLRVAPKA